VKLSKPVLAFAAAMTMLVSTAEVYSAEPLWIYDGTTSVWTVWRDGTITNESQPYFGYVAPVGADAVAGFSDAHAKSLATGLSAAVFAVATAGLHSAGANARANNTYVMDPGRYTVSFDYVVGAQAPTDPLAKSWAGVGFEYEMTEHTISESGSGHFSSTMQLPGWIAFFAFAGASAADGTAQTQASLANISVTPIPEPATSLLFLFGGAIVAAARRRSIQRSTR